MVQDERIIVGFVELFLIGVGLSMDAFAVSVCKGLGMSRLNIRQATIISLFFGGFQALMPLIGWALGSQLADLITPIDHWIAFALLAFVGGKMLWDAFHEDDEQGEEAQDAKLDLKELIMLAIATSIDALAVGITFAFLQVDIVPSVAIIGVVTPDVPIWDGGKAGIEECTYEAASTAVKEAIQAINGQADVIVVSAHMGLYAEFDEEGGSDSAQKILDDNPEVDVLQVAHNHVVVKQKEGNVVIGGVRNSGRDIARFDLTLDADKNIVDSSVEIVDMTGVTPSEELRANPVVAKAHQETRDFIKGGTGADGEKGSALGSTTAKFQPTNEIAGLPEGKLRDTAVMDLINKVQLENSGADVSAAALFKDTSDLPKGEINYGNIFDIYKFDNTLYRVRVTGAELKAYMEWSAECYNQWVPGDINISFDPEYPGYLYDMFAGVDYEIDLSQPKGQRIKNVMFHGAPLQDDQTLTLAVNNYRYSSALKSQGLVSGKKEWESSNSIRDMIVAYFAEHSPVAPEVDNNWKIVGVDLQETNPDRATLIALVNQGKIDAPYSKSLYLNDPAVQEILNDKSNAALRNWNRVKMFFTTK